MNFVSTILQRRLTRQSLYGLRSAVYKSTNGTDDYNNAGTMSPVEHAAALILKYHDNTRFDTLLQGVKPIGGTAGNIIYELKLEPRHSNAYGLLHGGMAAYLVNVLATLSQMTLKIPLGVNSGSQINFYRGARIGDTILMETQTVMVGSNLYHGSVCIKDKATGRILSQGLHTKLIGDKDVTERVDGASLHPNTSSDTSSDTSSNTSSNATQRSGSMTPVEHAAAVILQGKKISSFDTLVDGVKPVGGTPGNIIYEMKVEPNHTNAYGLLHGGMAAYLVDTLTGISQLTMNVAPGVSLGIHIKFYRGARIGQTVVIETETVMVGRNMYYANIYIKDKATGKLLTQGCHTKFIGGEFSKVSKLDYGG